MNIVKKLKNNELTTDEIISCLDSLNPIVLYEAMNCIVTNRIRDKAVTDKLILLSNLLSDEHKMLGYYKLGHIAMGALLKLGIDEQIVFKNDLDGFEKEMAIKFFQNAW